MESSSTVYMQIPVMREARLCPENIGKDGSLIFCRDREMISETSLSTNGGQEDRK